MEWFEWVFDGIGTTIIGAICSFIGYKAAVKKISKQSQIARDDSNQKQEKQEMFADDTEWHYYNSYRHSFSPCKCAKI